MKNLRFFPEKKKKKFKCLVCGKLVTDETGIWIVLDKRKRGDMLFGHDIICKKCYKGEYNRSFR